MTLLRGGCEGTGPVSVRLHGYRVKDEPRGSGCTVARGCRRFRRRLPSGLLSVLQADRDQDQGASGEAQEVEPGAFLVRDVREGVQALHQAELPEGQSEGEEQAVAGAGPEAEEEEARDDEARRDRAGEEIVDHRLIPPGPR